MKKEKLALKLIESLSASEQRYFNLNYISEGGNKNYVKLYKAFEVLLKTKENYTQFNAATKKMNLSYETDYLMKLIRRSLRNFSENSNPMITVLTLLTDFEILFQKGQYEFCEKIYEEGVEICIHHELFSEELRFYSQYRRLLTRQGNYIKLASENSRLKKLEDAIQEKLKNLNEYRFLQAEMLGLLGEKGIARNPAETKLYEKIYEHPLLQDSSLALSNKAILHFYELRNYYYFYTLQPIKAYENSKHTLTFLEEINYRTYDLFQTYFATLSNFINRCIHIEKFEEAFESLDKMKKLLEIKEDILTPSLQMQITTFVIEQSMTAYTFSNQYKKALEFHNKNISFLEKNKTHIRKTFYPVYNKLLAMVYLHLQKPEDAISVVSNILNDRDTEHRNDILLFAYILQVMAHFDIKNFDSIPYQLQQLKRFADKCNYKQECIGLFSKFITQYLKLSIKTKKKELKKAFLSEIERMESNQSDNIILSSIQMSNWVKKMS